MNYTASVILFLKKYRILAVLAIIFLAVLYLLFNYTILVVDIPDKSSVESLVARRNTESNQGGDKIRTGINLVRKGPLYVELSGNDMLTTTYLNIRALRINHTTLNLTPQKAVEKLTENGSHANCLFGTLSGVYYFCNQGRIYKKSLGSPGPGLPAFENINILEKPVPYQDGILAFINFLGAEQEGEEYVQLAYITPASVHIIDKEARRYAATTGGKIVTRSGEDFFTILNPAQKKFFLFNSWRASKPVEYSYENDLAGTSNQKNITLSFNENNIYLAHNTEADEQTENSEDIGHLVLSEYSRMSGIKLLRSIELPKTVKGASVVDVVRGTIFAHDGVTGELSILTLNNTLSDVVTLITNVEVTEVAGDSLYYIKDNKIFSYSDTDNSSHLVREASVSITTLTALGENLVFSGAPKASPSQLSTYGILHDRDKNKVEPFDLIPYSSSELPLISSDFSGNVLTFNVRLNSLVFYRDIESPSYDKREFELKQQVITRRLRSDGLDLDNYTLRFIPGP